MVPKSLWGNGRTYSAHYQWLPANLAFSEDGTVHFTSYINNLHPNKYPHIYRAIEELIGLAIPAWEQLENAQGHNLSRFDVPLEAQ
jgi:hypothetical protein